jgi:acyl carrier protein
MQNDAIAESVIAIVGTVLKMDAGPGTAQTNTPQWDSLKHIEIVFAVEDELGIQFTEDELGDLGTVEKLVTAVARKHAASTDA